MARHLQKNLENPDPHPAEERRHRGVAPIGVGASLNDCLCNYEMPGNAMRVLCAEPDGEDAYLIHFFVHKRFPRVQLECVATGDALSSALESARQRGYPRPDLIALSADLPDLPVIVSLIQCQRWLGQTRVLVMCEDCEDSIFGQRSFRGQIRVVVKDPHFTQLVQAIEDLARPEASHVAAVGTRERNNATCLPLSGSRSGIAEAVPDRRALRPRLHLRCLRSSFSENVQ